MKPSTCYLLWLIFAFSLHTNLVYANQYGETATCDFYSQTDLVKTVIDPNAHKLDDNIGFFSTTIGWKNEKGEVKIFFGNNKAQQIKKVSYLASCPDGARIESLTGIFNRFEYNIQFEKKPSNKTNFYSIWKAEFTDIENPHRKFDGELHCRITYRVYDSNSLESKTCKKQEDSNSSISNTSCSCAIS
jgi:hypothetical protein